MTNDSGDLVTDGKRDQTIDIARGIAIIAIVVGHALRGLGSAGLVDEDAMWFSRVDTSLYLFHLAVFVFLAGLFVRGAVEREGAGAYALQRSTTFLYLYLVWSLVQGGVKLATGALVNQPTSPLDVLAVWHPEGQLWFLPFMIVMTVIVGLVRPWRSRAAMIISLATTGSISLALWGFFGPFAGTQGLGLTALFFAGACYGAKRFLALVRTTPPVLAAWVAVTAIVVVAALVFLGTPTPPTQNGATRTSASVFTGVVSTSFGTLAVLALSRLLSVMQSAVRPLAFVGQHTMEIFLAHIIFASGTRIVLTQAGVQELSVHVLLGTLAGVVLPLVLWRVTRDTPARWLFTAPARPSRPATPVATPAEALSAASVAAGQSTSARS